MGSWGRPLQLLFICYSLGMVKATKIGQAGGQCWGIGKVLNRKMFAGEHKLRTGQGSGIRGALSHAGAELIIGR